MRFTKKDDGEIFEWSLKKDGETLEICHIKVGWDEKLFAWFYVLTCPKLEGKNGIAEIDRTNGLISYDRGNQGLLFVEDVLALMVEKIVSSLKDTQIKGVKFEFGEANDTMVIDRIIKCVTWKYKRHGDDIFDATGKVLNLALEKVRIGYSKTNAEENNKKKMDNGSDKYEIERMAIQNNSRNTPSKSTRNWKPMVKY